MISLRKPYYAWPWLLWLPGGSMVQIKLSRIATAQIKKKYKNNFSSLYSCFVYFLLLYKQPQHFLNLQNTKN